MITSMTKSIYGGTPEKRDADFAKFKSDADAFVARMESSNAESNMYQAATAGLRKGSEEHKARREARRLEREAEIAAANPGKAATMRESDLRIQKASEARSKIRNGLEPANEEEAALMQKMVGEDEVIHKRREARSRLEEGLSPRNEEEATLMQKLSEEEERMQVFMAKPKPSTIVPQCAAMTVCQCKRRGHGEMTYHDIDPFSLLIPKEFAICNNCERENFFKDGCGGYCCGKLDKDGEPCGYTLCRNCAINMFPLREQEGSKKLGGTKKKRCKRGKRRNKVTGRCRK